MQNEYKRAAEAAKADFDKQYPDGPPKAVRKVKDTTPKKDRVKRPPTPYNVRSAVQLPMRLTMQPARSLRSTSASLQFVSVCSRLACDSPCAGVLVTTNMGCMRVQVFVKERLPIIRAEQGVRLYHCTPMPFHTTTHHTTAHCGDAMHPRVGTLSLHADQWRCVCRLMTGA